MRRVWDRFVGARGVSALGVLALAVSSLVAMAAVPASATTGTVTLTKDVTVPAPPASTFAGATSGDGWDVQFYGDRIFNVFHHNPSSYQIDCHLQSDGSHCDTVGGTSPWPKTVTDSNGNGFATPGHATGWMDAATGKFYGWAMRTSDNTAGVLCVDTTSSAADPFCGFTALSGPNETALPFSGGVDGGAVVDGKMYGFNSTSTTGGASNTLLCFDTSTDAACADNPIALPGITSPPESMYDWTTAVGSDVIVYTQTQLTCLDAATDATCAGTWPVSTSSSWAGQPFPKMDATGTPDGVCLPVPGAVPCWDLTGAALPDNPALDAAIVGAGNWTNIATMGTRVYVAGPSSTVSCFDFGTGAGCPNFPVTEVGSSFMYTVNVDPVRAGCIWTNADSGSTQIQNFDAYTGASGCAGTVRITASTVIPQAGCVASAWQSVTIKDPTPANYTSATLDLRTPGGALIASNIPVDATGAVDLSKINLGTTTMPIFGFTFTNPTFSPGGIVLEFAWTSPDQAICYTGTNQTPPPASPPPAPVPAAPLNLHITPATFTPTSTGSGTSGGGSVTLSWTPGSTPTGVSVTGYSVTAQPGGVTCTTTGSTCTLTGLDPSVPYTYTVTVTASNGSQTVETFTTPTPTRIAGADRVATAIAVSQQWFPTPGSAHAVILTRSDIFPDALAGGPLAAAMVGPLLFTSPTALQPAVLAEIQRVLPAGDTVYLLGQTGALSTGVQQAVTAAGFHAVRIGGVDRYATSVAIAKLLNPTVVFEADGVNFPDAVSAGAVAAGQHGAVLLTNGSSQSPATAAYLTTLPGTTRYAVGGPAAAADPSATGLSGADRFATNAAVAQRFVTNPTTVGVATDATFADALAASPFIGSRGGALLLVNPTGGLPTSVAGYLTGHASGIAHVDVIGGTGAVPTPVAQQAANATLH